MRRLLYFSLLVVFLGTSLGCISASTDCQRWLAGYRQQLVHSRQLQRVAAIRRRARFYARRKLSSYLRHTTNQRPVAAPRRRMTPKQTLQHLDLACGVLPGDENTSSLSLEHAPDFAFDPQPRAEAGLLPAGAGGMLAESQIPPSPFGAETPDTATERSSSDAAPPGGGGGWGGGAGGRGGGDSTSGAASTTLPPTQTPLPEPSTPPTRKTPPFNPPAQSLFNPPSGPTPGSPAPPSNTLTVTQAPPAVVPEPASYVLLLTGLAGFAGTIRRRLLA